MQNEEFREPDYHAPPAKDLAAAAPEPEIVTPNNPPWNSPLAFGVWVLSVIAIMFFPAIFIVPYMVANRGSISPENMMSDPTAILLNLLGIIPAHLFTLAVAWFVATKANRFSLRETLGFESGGFQWWYYPLVIVAFFAVAALVGYFIPEGDNALLQMLRSSRTAVLVMAVLATFTAPVVEEVVYRGLLYSAFQRSFGVGWAVAAVTFLFAAVHVPQYWGSPGTIFLICLLSLVLTLIRVKTNNLMPCIIMHTIFNGIQSIGLIAEPYLPKTATGVEEKAAFFCRLFT